MVWILAMIGIMAVIVALLGVYMWKLSKKGWKHETDYRTFFYIGLAWLPLGLVSDMHFFFIMGLVYMAIGLANKDKWGKKTEVDPSAKKKMMIAVIAGLIALMIGVSIFLLIG